MKRQRLRARLRRKRNRRSGRPDGRNWINVTQTSLPPRKPGTWKRNASESGKLWLMLPGRLKRMLRSLRSTAANTKKRNARKPEGSVLKSATLRIAV